MGTVFALTTDLFSLVELGLGVRNVVGNAAFEDVCPKGGEIIAPAEIAGDGGALFVGRSVHELEILFVLRGGAGGDLVNPFAEMVMFGFAEAREGGEELIVAGDARRRNEAAHGKSIDERIVEGLIANCLGCRKLATGAGGRGRLGLGEGTKLRIDAEMVVNGGTDEGFA